MANIPTERTQRANLTRETEARQVSWKPAHDLPVPDPQDGYKFRWIRVSMMGQDDHRNVASSRREGWVPCKASDHPEISADFKAFGLTPSSDTIEIGGLLLCKTSVENANARRDYYDDLTQRQTQSVDSNFMRENDPRMPLFREGKSKVSFGSGS